MSRITTTALTLVLAPVLAAQEAPPTYRAESQVVVLDVVARDGKGRPVPDLRADEVQIFEDGKACSIESFRLMRGLAVEPATPAAPADAAPASEAAREAPAAPARANLVVLLFDRLSVQNAAAARQGALDLLKQRFPADTWFAASRWTARCDGSRPSRATRRS